MITPFDKSITELTPEQFELAVKEMIEAQGKSLMEFKTQHRENLKGVDGTYEIDVTARFEAIGGEILVLVECKHHRAPIKRDVVEVLYNRILSTGAHKGMIFATTNFQRGAIEFAKAHRIALIRIIEGKTTYETRALYGPTEPPPWVDIPEHVGWLTGLTDEGHIQQSLVSRRDPESLKKFVFGQSGQP